MYIYSLESGRANHDDTSITLVQKQDVSCVYCLVFKLMHRYKSMYSSHSMFTLWCSQSKMIGPKCFEIYHYTNNNQLLLYTLFLVFITGFSLIYGNDELYASLTWSYSTCFWVKKMNKLLNIFECLYNGIDNTWFMIGWRGVHIFTWNARHIGPVLK